MELDGGLGMQRIRTFETLPAKHFRGIGGVVDGKIFRDPGRIVGKQLAVQRSLRVFTDSYPKKWELFLIF